MEHHQVVGMIGALLLFIGVFSPIVSIPLMGSIIYFEPGGEWTCQSRRQRGRTTWSRA